MTMDTSPRIGDWMQTYTGRAFWPLDPRADEIDILDIAHALSHQCRYAGHCKRFYSVAEHSIWCAVVAVIPGSDFNTFRDINDAAVMARSRLRPEHAPIARLAFAALLHDAAEAYLVDLPRPVKASMPDYRLAEARLEALIFRRYGLASHPNVKTLDERMLATEAKALMATPPMDWALSAAPYTIPARLLGTSSIDTVESLFLWLAGSLATLNMEADRG